MKICPACSIQYNDQAEFCEKCNALLVKTTDKKPLKTDYKRLFLSVAAVVLFIGSIYALYLLLAGLP